MWVSAFQFMILWKLENPSSSPVKYTRNLGPYFYTPLLGDGASHTKVRFRMLVFRPHMEEVLVGKIKSCSKEGVHVSLEFFDDILIPAESLQHPSRFDETESVWVWEYPTEVGTHKVATFNLKMVFKIRKMNTTTCLWILESRLGSEPCLSSLWTLVPPSLR